MIELTSDQAALLERVRRAMEAYFGDDRRRANHALEVAAFARKLLDEIEADPVVTLGAAFLHDIGIPEAERKYGHCAGPLQEREGPPVARNLLKDIGVDPIITENICSLVGRHHTPAGIDSQSFRILWDADALVNLAEVVEGKSPPQIEMMINKALVTEPGRRHARNIYLSAVDRW